METVTLTINGAHVVAQVPDNLTLLRFLRDGHRLTGTKNGCSQGDCWACTVLIDGVPTRACLTKVSRLNGKTVETIEGLAKGSELHALQQAFIDHGAVQCGFCTPGMMMHAKALLRENPNPTAEEIVKGLGDHLCRCTGYVAIVDAVQNAAAVMRGERSPHAGEFDRTADGEVIIGASIPDKDGVARVCGQLPFADDIYFEGMLWGKILFASLPHAEIVSIDWSEAEGVAGVHSVLTARDIPGPNLYGLFPPDRPVLCDRKVRLLGDAVAVVFADTLYAAEQAVKRIKVEYRELEVVDSPRRGLEAGAPTLHERGNILKRTTVKKGNVDKGFAASDVIVEGHYETQWVEHAYLEPEAGVARPTSDGGVEVYYPTQDPFRNRAVVARNLGLPEEKVRLISTPMGGAFGGKVDIVLEILLALGALRTRRPVKITLTRAESLRTSGKRHPFSMDYKIGARRDGKLLALHASIVSDAGGYAGQSAAVLEQSMVFAGGPYQWPNVLVDGCAVCTNNPSGAPFRGYGTPQVHFALESTLDELARKLAMDPIDLRLLNALDKGKVTITGERLRHRVAFTATLRSVRKALRELAPLDGDRRIGIGIASGCKNVGIGRGFLNTAGAIFELQNDGGVLVRASAVDMGQGIRTVLGQVASATTGVAYDRIKIITGDTGLTPSGAAGSAQRQTFVAGNAVLKAGRAFKEAVQTYMSEQTGLAPERIAVEGDRVVDLGNGKRVLLSLSELGRMTNSEGEQIRAEARYNAPRTYPAKGDKSAVYARPGEEIPEDPRDYRNYVAYSYVTQAAIVEVNEDSGDVKVRRIISSHEIGRALNAQKVKGQLEGAAVMGMGYALSEEFIVENGRYRTNTLRKCGIPRMDQIPDIVLRIVEEPDVEGPYGAKGMSEVALVPAAAAIANAIYDAVGVRITSLPATREKVRQGLREKR